MSDDERLDFFDAEGAYLGVASRRRVHAEGLWHRTLHLWLAAPGDGGEGGGALLYQLRSATAANWPGLLDVSVAGHLLAGETYLDALREAREEIGVAVPRGAVVPLGIRREDRVDASGTNRELQGVHIARYDPAWGAFDAVDQEAAGLFSIGNRAGAALHRGDVATIECDGLIAAHGAVRAERRRLSVENFVSRTDGYYTAMHDRAEKLLRGERVRAIATGFDPCEGVDEAAAEGP